MGLIHKKHDHIQLNLLNKKKSMKTQKCISPIIYQKTKDQTSACVSVNQHLLRTEPHQTSGKQLQPITDVLRSPPVTNEAAMELRLLAEAANGIVGTGQVCSAGGNSTPPNGTVGGKKRKKGCVQACVSLCVCVFVKRMKVKS